LKRAAAREGERVYVRGVPSLGWVSENTKEGLAREEKGKLKSKNLSRYQRFKANG